jgi:hypothetical protein
MCFHAVEVLYEDGSHEPWIAPNVELDDLLTLRDLLSYPYNIIPTCSVVFRKGLFTEYPDWFFELGFTDWSTFVLNAQHGGIGFLDKVMSVYRVHAGGLWSAQDPVLSWKASLKFLRLVDAHLDGEYAKVIRRSEIECYRRLALEYEKRGQRFPGMYYRLRFVQGLPSGRSRQREELLRFARLYLPTLAKSARFLRRWYRESRHFVW